MTIYSKEAAKISTSYDAGKAVNQSSVNSQADNVLESSARVRAFTESLWAELRQHPQGSSEPVPCRSGLDGKLIDAAERSDATLSLLQEIRAYLLG